MLAGSKLPMLALGLCLATIAKADDCAPLEKAFNAAVAKQSIAEVREVKKKWLEDFVCGVYASAVQAKYVRFLIDLAAADPTQSTQSIAEASKILEILQDWRTAEALGDFYWRARDPKNAYHWYEESLNFLKGHPNQHPGLKEFQALMTKTGAAKAGEHGEEPVQGEFYKTR